MQIKFGKLGVRLFYNRMTKKKEWPPKDWPPQNKYRVKTDVDALGDGIFSHQLDLYYANDDVRKNRLLIDIHGGGYIANTRKFNYGFASVFLEEGYDVAVLDYPLNDGVQDVIDQVRVLAKQLLFLRSHAEELEIGQDTFFLTGDSAGGHFALLLAEMAEDPSLSQQIAGVDLSGLSLKAVAVNCPVYNYIRVIEESPLNNRGKAALFGPSSLKEDHAALISPKTYIASLQTPVLVSSCREDFLRTHSEELVNDLKEAGRPPVFVFLDFIKPGVGHVHNVLSISLPESRYVNEEMMRFLQ